MSLITTIFFAKNSIESISYVESIFYKWIYYFFCYVIIGAISGFIFSFLFMYLAKYEEYFNRKSERSKEWTELQKQKLSNWIKEQEEISLINKTNKNLSDDEYRQYRRYYRNKHYELSQKIYEEPPFNLLLFIEGAFLYFYGLCFTCVLAWVLVLPPGGTNLSDGLYEIYLKTEKHKDIYYYFLIGAIIGLVMYFRKNIKSL